MCNKHFTSHCTPCSPGGPISATPPLAALTTGSKFTRSTTQGWHFYNTYLTLTPWFCWAAPANVRCCFVLSQSFTPWPEVFEQQSAEPVWCYKFAEIVFISPCLHGFCASSSVEQTMWLNGFFCLSVLRSQTQPAVWTGCLIFKILRLCSSCTWLPCWLDL